MDSSIKLMQFSRAGGCGCKIDSLTLDSILKSEEKNMFPNLLVGNEAKDDAAVYKISEDQAIVSTTDFFMPMVNDAFDFGRISAVNAISDIYAMGGRPLMATAILGWPIGKIPIEECKKVIEGAKSICSKINIPLAGGHSVDTIEPMFGLNVTGLINPKKVKRNNTVKDGDFLFLTKPIGTGILNTAIKKGVLKPEHYPQMLYSMCTLNDIGLRLAELDYVNALTDVTGFGLAGHLIEMVQNTSLAAEINYNDLPLMNGVKEYAAQLIYPGNTTKNFNTVKDKSIGMVDLKFIELCDPQTSGGLLISVSKDFINDWKEYINVNRIENISEIGRIVKFNTHKLSII